MSLVQALSQKSSAADDHAPIIRLKEDHRTAHGGWQEWVVGCICGFYDAGTPGKWFIPSEVSANRLYEAHLERAGVRVVERDIFAPDDEPEHEVDYELCQEVIGQGLMILLQPFFDLMGVKDTFSTLKTVIFELEELHRKEERVDL